MKRKSFILIRTRNLVRKVYVGEIDYILQVQRKIKIVCESGEFEYYEKISNVEGILGASYFKVLKSAYINLDRVDAMYCQCIEFCDGRKLYVGRSSFIAARQKFCTYMLQGKGFVEG